MVKMRPLQTKFLTLLLGFALLLAIAPPSSAWMAPPEQYHAEVEGWPDPDDPSVQTPDTGERSDVEPAPAWNWLAPLESIKSWLAVIDQLLPDRTRASDDSR